MRVFCFVVCVLCAAFPADLAGAATYKARRTFVPDKGHHNPFGKPDVLAADVPEHVGNLSGGADHHDRMAGPAVGPRVRRPAAGDPEASQQCGGQSADG